MHPVTSGRGGTWAAVVAGMLVFYVLSPGLFLAWKVRWLKASPSIPLRIERAAEQVYAPLFWVIGRAPARVGAVYEEYLYWCAGED